jgi:hypothetical protein
MIRFASACSRLQGGMAAPIEAICADDLFIVGLRPVLNDIWLRLLPRLSFVISFEEDAFASIKH